MTLSPERIELGKTRSGGSQAAAIMGLHPYQTRYQAYLEAIGEGAPRDETYPMLRGTHLGPAVWDIYRAITGEYVSHRGRHEKSLTHSDYPRLVSTPDARIKRTEYGKPYAAGETKSAGWRTLQRYGAPGTQEIPDEVLVQVHCEMIVLDVSEARVVLPLDTELAVYPIIRSDKLCIAINDALNGFWENHVLPRVPPPVEAADENDLKRIHAVAVVGKAREPDEEIALWAAIKLDAAEILQKDEYKAATEKEKEAKAKLRALMGDAMICQGEGYKVTWKNNKNKTVTDYKAIAEAMNTPDDMIVQYTREIPGARVLRVA